MFADSSREERRAVFDTTHWSVIVAAGESGGPAQGQALEILCRSYWLPVYAYIRGRGHKPDAAQDLTQEFFVRLLAKEWLAGIEPRVSRFRAFLLTAVSRFLANEYDHRTSAKRGGGARVLNLEDAEDLCGHEWPENPEHAYDRRWALAVMDRALSRLREEALDNGKLRQFESLSPFLSREPNAGEYDQVAAQLALSSKTAAVAVLRLRRRYREIVRAVIEETVSGHEDVEDELHYLIEVLRR